MKPSSPRKWNPRSQPAWLRRQPSFERLEDRTVPALFNVTTLADTIDINPGDGQALDSAGDTSLRAAVMEANALSGADSIQLMIGTHTLSLTGRGEDLARTGDLDVTDTAGLTILGTTALTAATAINAAGLDRVFHVFPSVSLRLVNVVVRGGSEVSGAGFANQGTLTIENSVVQSNVATSRGGGVDNNAGTLVVRDSTFSLNSGGIGGAISNAGGTMTIEATSFNNNTASTGGGALFDRSGSGTIRRSLFNNNVATSASGTGGAIATEGTIVTISDSTFTGNRASRGGAIHGRGEVTLTGSLLRGNLADVASATGNLGGAIYNESYMRVVNSTIAENSAGSATAFSGIAGAIENTGGFQLIHATVTGNRAHDGGGIRQTGGTFTVVNSVIAQNGTLGGNHIDVWGTFNSLGGNFIGYAPGSAGWIASDQRANGVIDPRLGPLQDNGGPTLTRASLDDSTLRDRGVTVVGSVLPSTDQRGFTRPAGTTYDIGAYEFQPLPNLAPTANGESYTLNEDTQLVIAAPGVLGNDTDPEGQPLSATLVAGPFGGTLSLSPSGAFVYTPFANFHGNDHFYYRARDGVNESNVALVQLTVSSVNDAPTAANNSYNVDEDTTLNGTTVLANDGDVDGDTLTAVLVAGPSHGSLTLNTNGTFSYTPTANYNGADSFTYRASDGSLSSNVATVNITVRAVNDAPAAVNDSYATDEDVALNGTTVLANDGDVDGNTLSAVLVAGPSHGSLTLNTNGAFTYTPAANYNGPDSFTYRASDGSLTSNVATVNLTIRSVNDAPAATNDSFSTDEDVGLNGTTVLANDGDVDGDTLTAVLVAGPSHGSLTLNTNGTFSYTPTANYNGADSFTYRASDGSLSSNVATVNITVRAVNDAPAAVNDSYATDEDVALNGTTVLANDGDVDGNTLSAVLVAGPSHGSLTLNTNGAFTYTPAANYNGPDSFTYRASDGSLTSNVATVNLTIRSVNDAPAATNDSFSTDEDVGLNGTTVLANDGDVDGDTLTGVLVAGPSHGSLTLNTNGTFSYTPTANYNGPDSFTYRASDGSLNSNVATVNMTVRSVNDAPVARDDAYSTVQGTLLNVAAAGVLGNDTDVDADVLTAALVTGPSHGTLSLNADGSFSYNPNPAFSGADSFTYRAGDGSLSSNLATVTLQVTPAPSNAGKITGGGWFDSGARHFNINIESREQRGEFRYSGDLDFYDSVNNISLKSTTITFFRVEADGRGVISGQAMVNGRSGYSFTLTVGDLSSGDRFRIVISGPDGFAYDSIDFASAAGLIESGNIRVHYRR